MPFDAGGVIVGWLVQIVGDQLISAGDQHRKLRAAVSAGVRAVLAEIADEEARESLQAVLRERFTELPALPGRAPGEIRPRLAAAVRAQLAPLADPDNTTTDSSYLDQIGVPLDWLADRLTSAIVAAIHDVASASDFSALAVRLGFEDLRAELRRGSPVDAVDGLLREPLRDGRLPRLSELADSALGVTPTRYTMDGAAPYVARNTVDSELRKALHGTGPPYPAVVVHGHAKAGKSRTLAEACRHTWPDAPVIIPRDGRAAAAFVALDPPIPVTPEPALFWLDDLTGAELDELTPAGLAKARQRAVVVGTITDQRLYALLRTGSEAGTAGQAALRTMTLLPLEFELTDAERTTAKQLYPDLEIRASIGESLVGGEELLRRLRAGRADHPAGASIVLAAVDCRRAGLHRDLTEPELMRLFPKYLRRLHSGLEPTTDRFRDGLSWAAAPVASQVALLRRDDTSGEPRWQILDYIVEHHTEGSAAARRFQPVGDGRYRVGEHSYLSFTGDLRRLATARPPADILWDEVAGLVRPDEAFLVALEAFVHRQFRPAAALLRLAQQDPTLTAQASVNLGNLLWRQLDDPDGAREAYQQAIDTADPQHAAEAACNLGMLLDELGDKGGAFAAYRQAIRSDATDVVYRASCGLGTLLHGMGQYGGARKAYVRAMESPDITVAANAAFCLGNLLRQRGNMSGAREAYQWAIDSGDPEGAPKAAVNLGLMSEELGDLAAAVRALEVAAAADHPVYTPKAREVLSELTGQQRRRARPKG